MKKAFFIALKEVRDFLVDKGDLSFSLLMPIAIFALMYGAFGGSLQFNGTAYVVNQDVGGKYSSQFLQRLSGFPGLTVQNLSAEDADSRLARSEVVIVLFIPNDFSTKLLSGQSAQLDFKQRGNGGMEGQIVVSLAQAAARSISQELQIQNQVKTVLAGSNTDATLISTAVQKYLAEENLNPTYTLVETSAGSSRPDPVNQFLPGIITMFVLFAVNLTAQTLVEERRKGTLERLLTTRLTTGQLFAGKFLAYLSRGFVQTAILLALAYAVFRLFTPFSFLEALVLAIIYCASASAIGLIIGSVSRSENQATWISVFFTMAMVMLSGTFVAVTKGTLLYTLSRLSINTYANDAFRILIAQGGTLADARFEIMVLSGVAVVGIFVARFLFRVSQVGKG